jgi:hypothetical protein
LTLKTSASDVKKYVFTKEFAGAPALTASAEGGVIAPRLNVTVAASAAEAARLAKRRLANPANFLVMMHLAPVVSKFIRQDPKK